MGIRAVKDEMNNDDDVDDDDASDDSVRISEDAVQTLENVYRYPRAYRRPMFHVFSPMSSFQLGLFITTPLSPPITSLNHPSSTSLSGFPIYQVISLPSLSQT